MSTFSPAEGLEFSKGLPLGKRRSLPRCARRGISLDFPPGGRKAFFTPLWGA